MLRVAVAALLLAWASAGQAQVQVKDAWHVPRCRAVGNRRLHVTHLRRRRAPRRRVKFSGGVVEIHEMVMDAT